MVHPVTNKINNLYSFLSLCCLAFSFIFFLNPSPSYANSIKSANTEVDLISEVIAVDSLRSFHVALRMKMDEGWHVYWKNPGDSGLPPAIDWDLPDGFSAGDILWPYPHQLYVPPLMTYGYEGEVLLLTEVFRDESIKLMADVPVNIVANVRWLACKEICVPGTAKLSMNLPVKKSSHVETNVNASYAALIEKHVGNFPVSIASQKRNLGVKAFNNGDYIELRIPNPLIIFDGRLPSIQFFPDDHGLIQYSAKQSINITSDYILNVVKFAEFAEYGLQRVKGVLVTDNAVALGWSRRAVEIDIPLEEMVLSKGLTPSVVGQGTPVNSVSRGQVVGLWMASLFAFIGGLILNLMPCVLPVLSIKVLSVLQYSEESRRKRILNGLQFAAGIIFSFWVLALAVLVLKAAGHKVGWGFQFQSPVFVITMGMLFFLMGLNLFGVFEVATKLTQVSGAAQAYPRGWQTFLNGVLATVVATPCTAPFMGSALGVALSKPPGFAIVVFTFLGLGLSFPYLVIAVFPSLLVFIPKPGRWMVVLKKIFGFLFMITVLWLVWVIGIQRGLDAVMSLLVGLLFTAIAGWVYGEWVTLSRPVLSRRVAIVVAGTFLMVGWIIAFKGVSSKNQTGSISHFGGSEKSTSEGIVWKNFSEDLIDELRTSNRIVFINFTASWCLSCQVNDQVVFKNKKIIEAFRQYNIAAIKADWTNNDEVIAQALAVFGKSSIPVYVFYPPGKEREPVLLPEILTPGIVLQTIEELRLK